MTGNNKFWRASLAGLASVAMLATMGVAASTADAAAQVKPYDFDVTLHANAPANTGFTVNGEADADVDFNAIDADDDSKLDELYTTSAYNFDKGTTADGWTFTGWYTSPDYGSEKFDFANTTVTKHVDLYAHWAEADRLVTLTFNHGGLFDDTVYGSAYSTKANSFAINNSGDSKLKVAEQDAKVAAWELPADHAGDSTVVDTWKVGTDTVTLDDLTKGFAGKLLHGTGPFNVVLNPVKPEAPNATSVYYWEKNDGRWDLGAADEVIDVKFGEAIPTNPTLKDGFNHVANWQYKDSVSGDLVDLKGLTANKDYLQLLVVPAGKTTSVFTVTYKTWVNGKEKTLAVENVEANQTPKASYTPSRDGYQFAGWTKSNEEFAQNTVNLSTLKINDDATLYAVWTTNKASVTFDYRYSKKTDVKSFTSGENYNYFDAPTATRPGYQFLGWYTDGTDNDPFGTPNDNYGISAEKDANYTDGVFVNAFINGKDGKVGWVESRDLTTKVANGKWLEKYTYTFKDWFGDHTVSVSPYYTNLTVIPVGAKLRITAQGTLQYEKVTSKNDPDGNKTEASWVDVPSTLYAAWGLTNKTDLNNQETQLPTDNAGELADSADFTESSRAAYAEAYKKYLAHKNELTKNGTVDLTDDQAATLATELAAAKALLEETTDTAVYRLYNPYTGDHLYTTDTKEYSDLQKIGWKGESEQFKVLSADKYGLSTAVYRVYNPYTDEHLLTTDTAEVANLVKAGWLEDFDGQPAFYAPQGGNVDVTRLFNPYATVGTHLYSTDQKEIDMNVKLGWVKDNPAVIFSTR